MMDGIGPIRVLVLETEPEAANHARDALSGDERMLLVGTVTDQGSLLDKLGATYAQVAVVDLAGLRGEVGPAVREILSRAPECCVIVTVALARRAKSSVALVDLDLQFGDVGIALDLKSANSIADLLNHVDAIDASLIDEVFVRHSSGVRALLAPDNLASVPAIDPDRVARVVDQLRPHFQYIVCDLWSSLEELTLGTLRMADRIILVTTPELPALRNLRRVMSATGLLLQDERTLLVANRVPGKAGIGVNEIERGLGRPIAATIPSEGVGITEAINRGMSILDERARAKSGGSYRKLAEIIAQGLEPAALARSPRRTA